MSALPIELVTIQVIEPTPRVSGFPLYGWVLLKCCWMMIQGHAWRATVPWHKCSRCLRWKEKGEEETERVSLERIIYFNIFPYPVPLNPDTRHKTSLPSYVSHSHSSTVWLMLLKP